MSTVEQQLTELFEAKASATPASRGLLQGTVRRSRRRRMRRQIAATMTLVTLGAVGVLAARLVPGRESSAAYAHGLVTRPSEIIEGTFPFTATYLPPHTSRVPELHVWSFPGRRPHDGPYVESSWRRIEASTDNWIALRESGGPRSDGEVVGTAFVRGHAATVRDLFSTAGTAGLTDRQRVLSWEEAPGRFLDLQYDAELTLQQVRRVAEGLRAEEVRQVSWVRLGTGIDRAAIGLWSLSDVIFGPSPLNSSGDQYLNAFGCRHGTYQMSAGLTPTMLNGQQYLYERESATKVLVVKELATGTDLIADLGGRTWTDAEVAQVMEGLSWTGPVPTPLSIPGTC